MIAQFGIRLLIALLLGSLVGLERQWRQRMAGTRTNALVAAGAAAFVMAGSLIDGDPQARARMASYVVSGIGFLGAGVIFKEGGAVRGLNTAATIWCSAAIGVLTGLGAISFAVLVSLAVLAANIVLRPLSYRLYPAVAEIPSTDTIYEVTLVCRAVDESHARTLLMNAIQQTGGSVHSLFSEDIEGSDRSRIRAELSHISGNGESVEKIITRLSIEPGISAISWSVLPAQVE